MKVRSILLQDFKITNCMLFTTKMQWIFLCVVCIASFSGAMSNKCLIETSESKDFSAFFVKTIHLNHSKNVEVTWQAARGTTNISIWVSDDVKLSTDDIINGKLNVEATAGAPNSGSGMSARFCMGLLLVSSAIYYLTIDGQKKWSAVCVLVLASFFTVGNTQNVTSCKMGPSIHIQIPTNMVKEMCVNGQCRLLICKLSLTSEYSDIPSNNRVLFLDDQCTIKKPDLWDEWLAYFFGNGTTQDYYGDFDNDGLVNILEYYGAEAFEGNFVIIDRSLKNNVGNSTDSNNEPTRGKRNIRVRRQGEDLAALLADILKRGTSPLKVNFRNLL